MPTYDLEDLVADTKAMLLSKLNTEIALVEAEKVAAGREASSDEGLLPIEEDAYFELAWNDVATNKNLCLGIFLGDHEEQGESGFTRTTYTVEVGIVVSGTANDKLATRRLLRYTRALRQTFEKYSGKINNGITRESLKTIGPIPFTLNVDSADDCKIAGISFQCVLG
jgi:hypothetical protein